jgi:hypothetical protein
MKRDVQPKDVATHLGLSVDTIGRYARDGLIPFVTTPKGHRRFNLIEVVQALADLKGPDLSRLRFSPDPDRSRLIFGPPVNFSESSRLREKLRSTRTIPASDVSEPSTSSGEPVADTALEQVLRNARRVLVAAAL